MTSRMGGKKADNKGSKKETKEAAPSNDTWKRSKCTEADLQSLVDEGLLQDQSVVQWRPTASESAPYERTKEIVLF